MASAALIEAYYESGNAPHEALGRAARQASNGGALYIGGGVGVEKVKKGDAETFSVTTGAGKAESFPGPLSAVVRAFAIAGGSTAIDSPGGSTAVADPAAAARLRELNDEEATCQRDLDRYQRQLARKAQAQSAGRIPWSPGSGSLSDDAWEARRIEELKADLTSIAKERAKLLSAGKVEEVEQARPGTNFTKIPPQNVARLKGIIEHYKKMAHPFRACVRDQLKHGLSEDHANRRCAVVKDLGEGTTKWRKGGGKKLSKVAEALLVEAMGRLDVVIEEYGLAATLQLAEGMESPLTAVTALAEGVANDFGLLSLAGHPLALAVFGIAEAFDEEMHPRDFLGQFKRKLAGMKVGDTAHVPGGVKVERHDGGFKITGGAGLGHHKVGSEFHTGRPAADENLNAPGPAAMLAVTRSLRSRDPKSFGGDKHYQGLTDYEKERGKPGAPSMQAILTDISTADKAGRKPTKALDALHGYTPAQLGTFTDRERGHLAGIAAKHGHPVEAKLRARDEHPHRMVKGHHTILPGEPGYKPDPNAPRSTLKWNPKTEKLEGTYRGVEMEKGTAYQFTIGKTVQTVRWDGTVDEHGEPIFKHVDSGERRSARSADSFAKLADVQPTDRSVKATGDRMRKRVARLKGSAPERPRSR